MDDHAPPVADPSPPASPSESSTLANPTTPVSPSSAALELSERNSVSPASAALNLNEEPAAPGPQPLTSTFASSIMRRREA
ncbi:unnamed protein product, partial [Tilletia caries]